MKKLYHGSNQPIEAIDLAKSKVGKDFGCGFYLSDDFQQAWKQANNTTNRLRTGQPTVTTFLFDDSQLASQHLRIKRFDAYTEQWAEFVMQNRRNRERKLLHEFDIVYGPIANDTVGVQLRRYVEGYITVSQLVEELKYNQGITFQYFFGTELAIRQLQKI